MPIQNQDTQINYGFMNVPLSGNSISGDPTGIGLISGVSTGATGVFDFTLSSPPPVAWDVNSLYSVHVTPLVSGSDVVLWSVKNLGVDGFTVLFKNAAGTATCPSAGFTVEIQLMIV